MEGYNRSSHAVYRCEYHFVWVPKYRYHVLVKDVKPRLKEILVELCNWRDITIIEGAICSDHVHMYLSVPPKYSPAEVMKLLKGKSAALRHQQDDYGRPGVLFIGPISEFPHWQGFKAKYFKSATYSTDSTGI